jgi:hypothetical protein
VHESFHPLIIALQVQYRLDDSQGFVYSIPVFNKKETRKFNSFEYEHSLVFLIEVPYLHQINDEFYTNVQIKFLSLKAFKWTILDEFVLIQVLRLIDNILEFVQDVLEEVDRVDWMHVRMILFLMMLFLFDKLNC